MSSAGRVVAALVAVGVLLSAVVVGSGGSAPVGAEGSRRPSEWLLDVLISLLLVQLAIGSVLCVVLLILRPQEVIDPATAADRKRGRTIAGVLFLLLLLVVAVAIRRISSDDPRGVASNLIDGAVGSDGFGAVADRYEPEFAPVPLVVLGTLLAVAAVAFLAARRATRATGLADESVQAALAEALDVGIDDIASESDPRRAVIAAYVRLEHVLAAHGAARRPSEAPDEYLRRVLSSVDLSRRAVSRLTSLFQAAKFSHHEVDAAMKQEAIDALVSARDELRAARELAEAERRAALERASAGQAGA